MTMKLSLAHLAELPAGVAVPRYARSELQAGIMHFGVGNFHRSHQAVYLDRLFNTGKGHDWAIVGAGVFAGEKAGRLKLKEQDWLTTVVEQDAGHRKAHVTGVMIDFLTPGDADAIIGKLADPAIRIVSLTITEGGYFIDPASGEFDPAHPDIVWDANNIAGPKSVFGLILAGIIRRRELGVKPFTVMSCDNIPHNGKVTADAVTGLAGLIDKELANWVRESVTFPNGMVDRITPATTDRERSMLAKDFGVEDNWPVFCEPFIQWVLEDTFTNGRPALEEVGVQFVEDVSPFELMKIRILNGGHATIAYVSGLLDIHFVHEGMEDPMVRGFLDKLEKEEIIPTLPPVPGVVLDDYYAMIARRFSNPTIGDTIRRLCLDGSNRQPKFIIPTISDRLKAGHGVRGLALETALWCRYCFGTTDSGAVIEPNDPNWSRMTATAKASKDDPTEWLAMGDIYGEVGLNALFRDAFSHSLKSLWSEGTRITVQRYLDAA